MSRNPLRPLAIAFAVLLAGATTASAQMTLLGDWREMHVRAEYQGVTDASDYVISDPSMVLSNFLIATASNDDGSAQAYTFQASEFFPAGINISVVTQGEWSGIPDGWHSGVSIAFFKFRVDSSITYMLDLTQNEGDAETGGATQLTEHAGGQSVALIDLPPVSGHQVLQGRLSPGEYWLGAQSGVSNRCESCNGPTISMIWLCTRNPAPLIAVQPQGGRVVPNTTTTCWVTPRQPSGTLSYQWRRNLVPLLDDGHFTGTHTSQLSIHSTTVADTGAYDVVLTDGPIVEPSSLVALLPPATSSVEPLTAPADADFALGVAQPNPTRGTTTFRFAARGRVQLEAGVFDAAGRLVRSLPTGGPAREGTLAWDGRTAGGSVAPAGIYFLRAAAGGHALVRRFARLP